jgi:diguanylate cyclase (GGDEF)-like protein
MQKLIFIVDSNDANLKAAAAALEAHFRVLTMPSAVKMFSLLEKQQPSLILLDIDTPDMDGFEALSKLKGHTKWYDIPVILMTGTVDELLFPRALKLGVNKVLDKPIVPSVLLDCVKTYIQGNAHSVLIVDDQELSITMLRKILDRDYTIFAADNGPEAIRLAKKHLPDVILLDIMMLDMDGFAVIAVLKRTEKTKDIPVIFITGLANDEDEEKGLALGAADYITKPFSPAVVKLRLRNQIMIHEQLHTIERLSMLDQLTDLPNRRSFETRSKLELSRTMRDQQPLSILLIDVDQFKAYNDSFSHQQGDIALQTLAKVFPQILNRPGDFAARWGGEEFVVLLPDTGSSGALKIAEKIRKLTEDMEIPSRDGLGSKITISIGVSTRNPAYNCTLDELISKADLALYDSKNMGRNRVCFRA